METVTIACGRVSEVKMGGTQVARGPSRRKLSSVSNVC